ncbi:MAG: TonB-dependent receptor [Acidobacteria bacterium]|nr:TonB-dependent receptor [Acidobacteriota bacterium]
MLCFAACFLTPTAVQAQSGIAGVVKDTTGGALPGVTVEARSPALIEKVRTVVTNSEGQYSVIDLRPGTYSVTFTLPGFTTVKRDGIVLEADFTANVNAELPVGELQETLTVSGAAPVVDVQTTQRREVLTAKLLEALPSMRTFSTNTVPSLVRKPDVGGSGAMGHAIMQVYGSTEGMQMLIDGMGMDAGNSTPARYQNFGGFEEISYQLGSGNAEVQSGAVTVSLIAKSGGNQVRGEVVGVYSSKRLQSSNYTSKLKTAGLRVPPGLSKLWDANVSVGGPVKQDKLWYFISWRDWSTNNLIANVFNDDGSQAVQGNHLWDLTGRLTYQLSRNNKITGYYDYSVKNLNNFSLAAGVDPKASLIWNTLPGDAEYQLRWTGTLSNKLLITAGYSEDHYKATWRYQPGVARPSAANPYGDIAKRDLILGTTWGASPQGEQDFAIPYPRMMASVSYVTGDHALKVGAQWGWGSQSQAVVGKNGDIVQQYRNGVPDSVVATNSPTAGLKTEMRNLGLYAQDSWRLDRLTLNPGVRFDYHTNQFPEQKVAAGRFTPARSFPAQSHVIDFKDVSPRLGVAFDLFGDGKTAIKASFGKYPFLETTVTALQFNPLVLSTDTRTWRDLNGDDIAQDNELGPSTNNRFGLRADINPDPNLKRVYSLLESVSIQRELAPGVGLLVSYNRRDYRNLMWINNVAVPFTAYTLVTIPDPRGNGQTLPVYNLLPAYRGLLNGVVSNSDENKRMYDGVDATLSARFSKGTVTVATSTGRLRTVTCEAAAPVVGVSQIGVAAGVAEPNALRFCDQRQYHIPFLTSGRIVWTYDLPYRLTFSGVFQSTPGGTGGIPDKTTIYSVGRNIVPTLTQATVNVALSEPGSQYYPRLNQLDIAAGRRFQVRHVQFEPKIEVFNVLNANPILSEITTFGPALGRPLEVLPPRVLRISANVKF